MTGGTAGKFSLVASDVLKRGSLDYERPPEGTVNSETFAVSSEPDAMPAEIAVVREGLHQFNFAATGMTQVHEVILFVRDAGGRIRGGLLGYVWAEWLHITELWMEDECRGRGLGSQLLDRAEREASRVGARGAFLSTFDFQAPRFYESRGYEVYRTFTGYPPGHTDYHLRKMFETRAEGRASRAARGSRRSG